ncbi:MAG: magnesium transporter CorA family protein [Nevskia sp.]|nr:magnesium transporter CorA family protein [Nevskia sp.]
MQIYQLNRQGEVPKRIDHVDQLPAEGFIWLDFTRSDAADWPMWAQKLSGGKVHDAHVTDSFNADHPSYFDGTEDYDMLIFRGLTPEACESTSNLIVTKSAAFFMFDRLLITVHAAQNVSFQCVKEKFCETKLRFPSTPIGLVHSILDIMVDRYLMIVDELEDRLEKLQDALLDPKDPFDDWQELLNYRKQAHQFELLCEHNLQTIGTWRRRMRVELTENQRVRLDDLVEHLTRVQVHGDALQKDVEVAVQLHFASMSHRTNEIVRTLTAVSIVFFPLTLITGLYGMNFDNMPELHWKYGYFMVLGVLVSLGSGLVFWLKRRKVF